MLCKCECNQNWMANVDLHVADVKPGSENTCWFLRFIQLRKFFKCTNKMQVFYEAMCCNLKFPDVTICIK